MKRLILSLMTVISFVLQPAVGYAASLPGMSYPYSASTIYNLARSSNSYKLTSLSKRDMDVTNQYGDTALCLAVRNHDKEAYNVLLEAGANPNPQCMNALESMRPIKSGLSSIFTPKLGYLVGLIAVGGGVALASGGGGGSKTCPGYTKADCPEAYHIEGVCEENIAYHKCSANKNNTTENCEVFVLNKDECATCKWNYYREGTDCKEREITENCEVFDDTEDACLICKNGYYLSYGACLKGDIDNCYVYESKEVCSTCEEGYVVTVNRDACVLPIEHCNTYGIDKSKGREVCMTCDTGYFPSKDGSTCVPKIEHCLIYENDGSCQECMPNYAVTEDKDKCVPYIDRCQEYNEDGTCKACETGYVYGEDAFHCVRQMDGCKEYSNDGKCTKCDATGDWSHLYEGKCYKAYQYCQEKSYGTPTCSASQYKNFCKLPDETGAETGIENKNYWLCEDGPENCKKTDQDTGLCIECNSGWYVDGGICYQQEITGCELYVTGQNKCEKCQNKFYKDEDGFCHGITVNNCEQNNTNENTCYQCSSSYYPNEVGTLCKKIAHCTASDGYDNSCTQCEDDYYLKDGVCIAKIDSCKEYNSDGTCEECESLYYINNDGATCSKIDSYDTCKGSDGKNNKCTTCNANYYPDTSGMCQEQSVANCDTYVENENKCEVCDNNGYKVNSSGQCEEIAKCNISNGKDACTTCDGDNAWYVNDDGTCSQNNECATTDGKTSTCTSCATDYYLDGGQCYGEQEYCDRQDNHGRDVTTNPCEAYQIAEMCQLSVTQQSEKYGKCVTGSDIAHCEVRDTDPSSQTVGKCTQCQTSGSDGAYIIADQGAACQKIDNCTESDGESACKTCDGDNAWYVAGGICSQNTECAKTNGKSSDCTSCLTDKPYLYEGHCYTEENYCVNALSENYKNLIEHPCELSYQDQEWCRLPGGDYSTTYGKCVEKGDIEHCIEQDTDPLSPTVGKCLKCETGGSDGAYIIADQGAACQMIDNCTESDGESACKTCDGAQAYYVKDGSCTQKARCSKTNGQDPNCTECQTDYPQKYDGSCYTEQEYCTEKLPEPYNDTTSCDSSSQYPKFCPLYTGGESSTYRRCTTGGIDNCNAYNQNPADPEQPECTGCDSGYYLSNNACKVQPKQPGCKTYLTDDQGCETCYAGFEKEGGTCVRDDNASAGDYYYRVSNYDAEKQETTQTRTSPMIKIVDESGEDDIYTIIGFTSANVGDGSQAGIATQDGHSSDTTTNATQYYTEYDVHNTSFEDDGTQITSKIELDGSQISVGDKLINNIDAGSGQFIGLSSPGTVTDNSFAFAGNANVYNAAGWYTSAIRTGQIKINYQPSDSFEGLNVYGIKSDNKAYNAYENITGKDNTEKIIGLISIVSTNKTDNYGIYAIGDAYNAYGRRADGTITLNSNNVSARFIGMASEANAYNASYTSHGRIEAIQYKSASSPISNQVVGMLVSSGNAYNAYLYDPDAYSTEGTIKLSSPNSIAMQATDGDADEDKGNLYNSYSTPDHTNATMGRIILPYGGVAFKTAGKAYNSYYGIGFITIGDDPEDEDHPEHNYSNERYTVCKDCAYFYNSYGTGANGTINIHGNVNTIANFINSGGIEGDGHGTVNIYTYAPNADLPNNTLNVIFGDENSSNGNNGHINVYLGRGWNPEDAPDELNPLDFRINPLNGVPLLGESTITITNKQETTVYHDASALEIKGVKNSYMSGVNAKITIATNWSDSYDTTHPLEHFIRARYISGIYIEDALEVPENTISGTINIQAAMSSDSAESKKSLAYGIYNNPKSGNLLTSNASVNMQIWGGGVKDRDMVDIAYGLYNVNNGTYGYIYIDSYSNENKGQVLDNAIGMSYEGDWNDNVTMQNAGTIAIGTNHQTGILVETQSGYVNDAIIGMFGQGEHVTNMENSGNTGNIAINSAWYRNVRGIWADDISSSGNITNSGNIIITAGAQDEESDENGFDIYGILSQNSITNIENSGTIQISSLQARDDNIARGDIYGIDAGSGASTQLATATNTGTIEIQINQKSTNQNIYGMWGGSYIDLYNGTVDDSVNAQINITAEKSVQDIIGMQTNGNPELAGYQSKAENRGKINILAKDTANNVFGMSALNHSEAYNYGYINIDVADPQGCVFGMYADHHSKIQNHGTINIKVNGSRVEKAGGLLATNYSFLLNESGAEINITVPGGAKRSTTETISNETEGAEGIYYFSYYGGVNVSPTAAFVIDDTSEIVNEGTITSQAAVNITGGGRMLMSRGAKLVAPSVTGALTLASDIVTEGNEDVYTTTNLVTGNSDNVTVESASAMFTASTVVNAEDENSVDGVLTRKSFDTMVQSAALANYLEDNYTGNNAQEFFATLKTASNASEFDEILSKELGLCLMPNFAQENFNVFRSLGNLITDNLFSKDMTQERMMVGYDYLALSRDTKKHVTGYENTSNSSYFLGDIALNKYSRFGLGLSITKFNSDYDDDSDRDEMFAQLLASYMYDFGNKWRYAGVLHSGYGWGDYTRKLNHGDVDGNLHDFIYGLQNEFRYGIETPYVTLEPQVEMNFTGYYQRRINEENKNGSIIMKGTNNFSAESGIGLYASKEFDLEKYGRFKGRVGGSYYHEWAHPYGSIKSRMRGTDGWYKIESDDIFERDRFMISADVTYTYKMFDLYVRGSQYFEKDTVAVFNAGLKYNF